MIASALSRTLRGPADPDLDPGPWTLEPDPKTLDLYPMTNCSSWVPLAICWGYQWPILCILTASWGSLRPPGSHPGASWGASGGLLGALPDISAPRSFLDVFWGLAQPLICFSSHPGNRDPSTKSQLSQSKRQWSE